jgi:hypothetical protein
VKRKFVQLLGGPTPGRTRLDLPDDGPVPVTICTTLDAIATYEYIGGGIYVYIGAEIVPDETEAG